MLEKKIEAYLVKLVRAKGGEAYKFTSPNRRSVPDRVVVFPNGRVSWVELKAPGRKPTEMQVREHQRLRELKQDVHLIDSIEGVNNFVAEMVNEIT